MGHCTLFLIVAQNICSR
ncbi:rCG35605 [Rattus norvegicus]|uniref:RCG35605 n=1 Tax=Rattus norvegicus TaxID=10116 RepID=A6HEH9_RAT|nr:rCG35605 [Rattus norvegicus]